MATALIVVDVQYDFCEEGALAVAGGHATADRIADFMDERAGDFDFVVASQDWHIEPGDHFSEDPDFIDSWPVHCVAGTRGAELVEAIDQESCDAFFHKGQYDGAYSAFEGTLAGDDAVTSGAEGGRAALETPEELSGRVSLEEWLRERDVDAVTVVGIATDYCVKATAVDAADAGFDVTVLLDLTAGIHPESIGAAVAAMEEAGVKVEGEEHDAHHG